MFFVFLCYFFALSSPFYFDDILNIRDNNAINSIINSLKCTVGGIRPLSYLSFSLNRYFFGNAPFFYRLFNIIFHLCMTVVVYKFSSYFLINFSAKEKNKWLPVFIAALWAVHPVNSQAVNYIVQRMTLLSSLFVLLAFLNYIKWKFEKKKKFLWVSIFLFLISLGFKETGIQYIILIFSFELVFGKKREFLVISFFSFIFGIFVTIFYFRTNDFSSFFTLLTTETSKGFSIYERLLTEPRIIIQYIFTLVFPAYSSIHLHFEKNIIKVMSDIRFIIPILFILFIIGLAIIKKNKYPKLSFFVISFFLLLLPESSILPLDLAYLHRLYLPSLFFLSFLVYLLNCAAKKLKTEKVLFGGVAVLLFFYSTNLIYRNIVYAEPVSFYENELMHCKTNPKIYNNFAGILLEHGITENVLPILEKCIDLGKMDFDTSQNFGLYYALKGDFNNALKFFKKAEHSRNPKLYTVYLNLVVVYIQLNDVKNAKYYLKEAEKIGTDEKLRHFQKLIKKETN